MIYKFRGKEKESKDWVHGNLFIEDAPLTCFSGEEMKETYWILLKNTRYTPDLNMPWQYVKAEVDAHTVGQYINCKDIGGNEVYTGDIVSFEEVDPIENWYGVVDFVKSAFMVIDPFGNDDMFVGDLFCEGYLDGKIIGNISDNPELLKLTSQLEHEKEVQNEQS